LKYNKLERKKVRQEELSKVHGSVSISDAAKNLQEFQKQKPGTKILGGMALPGMSEHTNNTSSQSQSSSNNTTTTSTSTSTPATTTTKTQALKVIRKGKTTTDYLSPRGPKELIYFRDSDVSILKQSETGWWLAGIFKNLFLLNKF